MKLRGELQDFGVLDQDSSETILSLFSLIHFPVSPIAFKKNKNKKTFLLKIFRFHKEIKDLRGQCCTKIC
jgi:hypothetical protein